MKDGIDVSVHQGDIDWGAVKRSGSEFAVCKASEGEDFRDRSWTRARVAAIRKVGILLGGYHYLRPRAGRTGAVEADWAVEQMLDAGWGRAGDLRVVCDIEETALPSAATRTYVEQFCDRIEKLTGQRPIIYTYVSFIGSHFPGETFNCPLWVAEYGVSAPAPLGAWDDWAIWQFTSSGRVPGIRGNVDLNRAKVLPVLTKAVAKPKPKPKPEKDKEPSAKEVLNGHPANVTDAVLAVARRAVKAGLIVTSTTDGRHSATSWHRANPVGRAIDLGLRSPEIGTSKGREKMVAFQRAEVARGPGNYNEIFGPDNAANVKNGARMSLAEGTALENQHDNHVHVAPR